MYLIYCTEASLLFNNLVPFQVQRSWKIKLTTLVHKLWILYNKNYHSVTADASTAGTGASHVLKITCLQYIQDCKCTVSPHLTLTWTTMFHSNADKFQWPVQWTMPRVGLIFLLAAGGIVTNLTPKYFWVLPLCGIMLCSTLSHCMLQFPGT